MSSVYFPSSIPDACVTRMLKQQFGALARAASIIAVPGCCSRMFQIIWIVSMSCSRSISSTASYSHPIAGPNAAPQARIFPSRLSARNVSQSSGCRTCSIFTL